MLKVVKKEIMEKVLKTQINIQGCIIYNTCKM